MNRHKSNPNSRHWRSLRNVGNLETMGDAIARVPKPPLILVPAPNLRISRVGRVTVNEPGHSRDGELIGTVGRIGKREWFSTTFKVPSVTLGSEYRTRTDAVTALSVHTWPNAQR